MGLCGEEIAQPAGGIATTRNMAAACNSMPLREPQAAKRGATGGGGAPREFTTIAVTDGGALGHAGMNASLSGASWKRAQIFGPARDGAMAYPGAAAEGNIYADI
jgi:dihydroxyacid dehydratase/phosphogluconate dehydratase